MLAWESFLLRTNNGFFQGEIVLITTSVATREVAFIMPAMRGCFVIDGKIPFCWQVKSDFHDGISFGVKGDVCCFRIYVTNGSNGHIGSFSGFVV